MNRTGLCDRRFAMAAALMGLCWPTVDAAELDRPLQSTLMVPYPPGGASFQLAQLLTPILSGYAQRPMCVDHLAGASGVLALQRIRRAPPDGRWLLQGSPNELILAPAVQPQAGYRSEDFVPLQILGDQPLVLLARPHLPVDNLDDLLLWARDQAQRKKPLTFASVGVGSLYHALGEHLARLCQAPMTHVPYKGGAGAVQDLMAEHVDLYFAPAGPHHWQRVLSGQLKALAMLAKPLSTTHWKGVASVLAQPRWGSLACETWTGIFCTRDVPSEVVVHWHEALARTLSDLRMVEILADQGFRARTPQSLKQASVQYAQQIRVFRKWVNSIKT